MPVETSSDWVDRTLSSLTLQEKIGQMLVPMLTRNSLGSLSMREWMERYKVGGGHVFGGQLETMVDFIEEAQATSSVPLLITGDLDKGCGERTKGGTIFQYQMALGAADSEELAYGLGRVIAQEAVAVGFNWTFSPIVDICGMPEYLRHIAAIGEDPEQIARLAVAQIKGIQEHGMAACAKHFPGDGLDDRDQHLTTLVNPLSAEEWRARSGYIFKRTIDAGVYTIMNSCIALPALDPGHGDPLFPRPSIISRPLIEDVLRGELGFDGVIVTDALNMGGVTHHAAQPERYALALEAGNDVLLFVTRLDQTIDYLVKCVKTGRFTEQRIEQSVRRILRLKETLGLHRPEARAPKQERIELFSDPPGREEARRLAEQSVTLLRDSKGAVPLELAGKRVGHVLITNRAAEFDTGVFEQVLSEAGCKVAHYVNPDPEPMYDEVAAGKFDVIITSLFFPLQWGWVTVRCHGPHIRSIMSGYHLAHPAVQPVFIIFGGPFHLREMAFMDPFLVTYGDAAAAQAAAAQILLGELRAVGKVPVSLDGFFKRGDGVCA